MTVRKFIVKPDQAITIESDDIIRLTLENGVISFAHLLPNADVLHHIHVEEI